MNKGFFKKLKSIEKGHVLEVRICRWVLLDLGPGLGEKNEWMLFLNQGEKKSTEGSKIA
jgi:hypothetical protein